MSKTFNDNSDDDRADDREPTPLLIAYLQLIRLPNVFTAMADVLMGFLFTHQSLEPLPVFFALLASSSLLYMSGMVLNDVFDVEIDRRERPERPLPSKIISTSWAKWLGVQMLLLGVGMALVASKLAEDFRCVVVAVILAMMIVAYDRVLKRTFFGPLAMGACRFLNVLLGMSAAVVPWIDERADWNATNFVAAGGIGLYIVGVTWFAKKEAVRSDKTQLALGTLIIYAGMGLLAALWYWNEDPYLLGLRPMIESPSRWFMLWGLLAMGITWRCWRAVLHPGPKHVQAAVQFAIFSLIVLDAIVCVAARGMQDAAIGGIPGPILIVGLLLPTMLLGRWIYAT